MSYYCPLMQVCALRGNDSLRILAVCASSPRFGVMANLPWMLTRSASCRPTGCPALPAATRWSACWSEEAVEAVVERTVARLVQEGVLTQHMEKAVATALAERMGEAVAASMAAPPSPNMTGAAAGRNCAPPASSDRLKAWGSPTHPRAPPQQLGGSAWPRQLASARAQDGDLPRSPTVHHQAPRRRPSRPSEKDAGPPPSPPRTRCGSPRRSRGRPAAA